MAPEDTPHKASGATQPQDNSTPSGGDDDAILRNLASLMGQEERAKEAFQSSGNPLPESEAAPQPGLPDNSPQNPDQLTNASAAAELRRLQRKNTQSANLGEDEIEVVFDEESHLGGQATESDAPNSAEPHTKQQPVDNHVSAPRHFIPALSILELTALAILLAALLYAAVAGTGLIVETFAFFRKAVPTEHTTPPSAISGQLVQLSGIQCHWRDRHSSDRVQADSRILPVINIESGEGNGSLQIIFRDETGRIMGDTHTFRISPSTLPPSGESVTINALCTSGMISEIQFADHRLGSGNEVNEYWTVSLKESADEENWTLIGTYRLPANRL